MSYCRFSDDSDVYVIGSTADLLECCGCSMGVPLQTNSYMAMIEHLKDHVDRGDKVPAEALEELKIEFRRYGDKYPPPDEEGE